MFVQVQSINGPPSGGINSLRLTVISALQAESSENGSFEPETITVS